MGSPSAEGAECTLQRIAEFRGERSISTAFCNKGGMVLWKCCARYGSRGSHAAADVAPCCCAQVVAIVGASGRRHVH